MYIQLLGTETGDSTPSFFIFFQEKRYLINVGEGTQRFSTEHKIRLSKVHEIFLTRVSAATVGGLPGAILTLADAGVRKLNIYGPPGIRSVLRAASPFMSRPELNLECQEWSDRTNANDRKDVFGDENLSIVPVWANSLQIRSVVSYLCLVNDTPGEFDPAKAKALGLKPGPLYKDLKAGRDVIFEVDGKTRTIRSADIVSPSLPGPTVLVADLPTEQHVIDLITSHPFPPHTYPSPSSTNNLANMASSSPLQRALGSRKLHAIIHLAPLHVLHTPTYLAWCASVDASVEHVFVALGMHAYTHADPNPFTSLSGLCPRGVVFRASSILFAKLNAFAPRLFPALFKEQNPWFLNHAVPDLGGPKPSQLA
jgi:ribonuclease Z